MATDCSHSHIKKSTVRREFLGRTFKADASVCLDCGAELWDEDLNAKFKLWVDALDIKQKVQFKISVGAEKCLNEMLKKFPSASQSTLVRAMILLYLNLLNRPDVKNIINEAFESKYFLSFENEEAIRPFGVDVKPSFFLDLASWGNLLDMKPNELGSEGFHVMLSLFIDTDEKLREFWNREVLPQLQTILKVS